jgi:arylsulfatase A-like enzyme
VVIDTLRPDHLGTYGYERETAPFLAELARDGAVFTDAFSTSSWTAPATASLFTSLHPIEHGVTMGLFAQKESHHDAGAAIVRRLPPSFATLPERLRERGYRTFGLAANANIGPEIGFSRGFERFERLHGLSRFDSAPAPALLAKLQEWGIDGKSDGSPFLYLHFNDVHAPYDRQEPYLVEGKPRPGEGPGARAKRSLYDSEIGLVDATLRELFTRQPFWRDGLVIVVSDHGEELLDHGAYGHRATLYGELVRVLLLVHGPGLGVKAGRHRGNVSLLDVLPTLMDLVGGSQDPLWRGVSLAGLLREETKGDALGLEERSLVSHRVRASQGQERELWSVTRGSFRLIRKEDGAEELYDVASDRGERVNAVDLHPDVADRLRKELGAFLSSVRPLSGGELQEVPLDAEDLRALEELGYVEKTGKRGG